MGATKAARCLWSSTAPDLSPLAGRTRHGSAAEAQNSQGAWAGGRARARGRSPGPPPPRPSGCPPRLPRARRSRRREKQEERSEPSPGALRDRVPGGGGGDGGSAPADSFHHLQPENGGPREVLLSQIIYTLTQSVEWLLDTRNLRRPCPL
ncbi:guanine nucleotide-binding protein G(I)/G(S)/G(O) subunit gamma-12 isoform X4 [Zalophus californianus]|uniref:Guanine nucleotide-binding protein G(I)/G(S)/G(O) subunit gamma-12 isoform X4 n=1 Tax=Zalophus californianus TaxID=9704 RepID=A0A6J2EPY1_ZALCA|nr:guanine nucleotide-binding protein G(I)/G(S)/G(O) subunit gamma-12 isoform X4 [Zalophus californianus]